MCKLMEKLGISFFTKVNSAGSDVCLEWMKKKNLTLSSLFLLGIYIYI